jgi:hypothetical protein
MRNPSYQPLKQKRERKKERGDNMRVRDFIIGLFFIHILILMCPLKAYSYGDKKTHPDLTERAVNDYSNLNNYLNNNLAVDNGINEMLHDSYLNETYSILEWLKKGSTDEDYKCRKSNHFHNPLEPWDASYMKDEPLIIQGLCILTGYGTKYSNVTWGTGYSSKGGSIISPNLQEMGWNDARKYYRWALSDSYDTERETYFAKTFQALGQVMHLLQDMSSPAHVREDFTSHWNPSPFNSAGWIGNPYELYVENNTQLVTNALVNTPDFTIAYPTDLWDTDQYNIGGAPPSTLSVGLAEYTNANYFSDSTIPANYPWLAIHRFNYPSINSSDYMICDDFVQGTTERRRYISRTARGGCPKLPSEAGSVDHFAAASLLNERNEISKNNIQFIRVWLDNNVHDTYARDLIPPTIGYSAELLNYFFRGEMDLVPLGGGQYEISNLSAEEMQGDFKLYYDDAEGVRRNVISYEAILWSGTLASGTSSSVTLTIPSEAEKLILVFHGRLGNEVGAVVGKVFNKVLEMVNHPISAINVTTTGQAWRDVNNVFESDDVYAVANGTGSSPTHVSDHLKTTGYGFSIPTDAVIESITFCAEVRNSSYPAGWDGDWGIFVVKNDVIQSTAHKLGWVETYDQLFCIAPDDLGVSLTPSDINNSGFGAALSAGFLSVPMGFCADEIYIIVRYINSIFN